MRTAFRAVLSSTSRRHNASLRGSVIIPAFRAPSVTPRTAFRGISTTTEQALPSELLPTGIPSPPTNKKPFGLSFPPPSIRQDPEAWVDVLEPALPQHLRKPAASEEPLHQPVEVTARDVSYILVQAQRTASIDILKYLGFEERRWDAVLWIIKFVVEQTPAQGGTLDEIRPFSSLRWLNSGSLDEVTSSAVWAEQLDESNSSVKSLDQLTLTSMDISNLGWDMRKGALGQIWRSLGSMILAAASMEPEQSRTVMPYVLQIIAYLHHSGVIPESIYRYVPAKDSSALQQPPTLHLLSSRILTSLSDAAWNAHAASAAAAAKLSEAQHPFQGHEIPGQRYKVKVAELGFEVWLELVLWSCLHGGWVLDGAAILEEMMALNGEAHWSLVCWRDIIQSSTVNNTSPKDVDWNELKHLADWEKTRTDTGEHKANRMLVERTISSELIAAYVDGLINMIRVGVGERGNAPVVILEHIKRLKSLLERQNMGLGVKTWDAVVLRFLESEGIAPEKDPALMLELLHLAQPYGKELESVNAPTDETRKAPPTYVMDASAAVLGLLHRTIQAYTEIGDIGGALKAFEQLQTYTDLNKRRSLEEFFRDLGSSSDGDRFAARETFDSNLSAVEFPSFFPQIPSNVLADLLDLITKAKQRKFGGWLLYSKEIDGPIIPATSYADRVLAPALIRFGTATRDKKLLQNILQVQSTVSSADGPRLPDEVLLAFLESQIEFRLWDSVENVFEYLSGRQEKAWVTGGLAILTREILRLEAPVPAAELDQRKKSSERAKALWNSLLKKNWGRVSSGVLDRLHSMVGVLASVNSDWADFCSFPLTRIRYQKLDMRTLPFNVILEGVVEAYGSLAGKQMWETWCKDIAGGRPPGLNTDAGIPRLPAERPSRADNIIRNSDAVVLEPVPGEPVTFRGRVTPDRTTLRIIVRKAVQEQKEEAQGRASYDVASAKDKREFLRWAARTMWHMGLSNDDVDLEFGDVTAWPGVHDDFSTQTDEDEPLG